MTKEHNFEERVLSDWTYRIPVKGRRSSMSTSLFERDCGTAPHPLTWKASESLLILIPQSFGLSSM